MRFACSFGPDESPSFPFTWHPDSACCGGCLLYRMYDREERLVYVGITQSPEARILKHRTRPWYPWVFRIDAHAYPSRALAREAELEAIRTEHPAVNIEGRVWA